MRGFLIRQAVASEQKELEELQLRASLTNAGDRDALLAHPDAIELPLAQIAAGGYLGRNGTERLSDLRLWNQEETERANLTHCSSTQTCDDVVLRDR